MTDDLSRAEKYLEHQKNFYGIPIEERQAFAKEHPIYFIDRDIKRDDPILIKVVEELWKEASGWFAQLEIIEIPDDVEWHIEEYDGNEHIAENHRTRS